MDLFADVIDEKALDNLPLDVIESLLDKLTKAGY
jgi:hypothetical protein